MKALRIRSRICAACALFLAPLMAAADLPKYHVQDIGLLDASDTWGTLGRAMNSSGQVAGYFERQELDFATRAFFWDGSTLQDLGTMLSAYSIATAVNDAGWVTGTDLREPLMVDFHFESRAFLWDGVNMIQYVWEGELETTFAVAINAQGLVLGNVHTLDDDNGIHDSPGRAFLWDGQTTSVIPEGDVRSELRTVGISLADDGTVLGRRYEWLGPGQTVGPVGFVWDGTSLEDLPFVPTPPVHELGDLNEAITPSHPEEPVFRRIEDVNDAGQILAVGHRAGAPQLPRSYVLTPIRLLIDRLQAELDGVGAGESLARRVEVLRAHYDAGRLSPLCAQLSSLRRGQRPRDLVFSLADDITDIETAVGCR